VKSAAFWGVSVRAFAARSHPKMRGFTTEIPKEPGKQTPILTIDHVIPRRLDGPHIWTNVVAACSACNHRKGGRRLEDAQMKLLGPPREPPSNAMYVFGRHLNENDEWEAFIRGW
jgi:hypothetical protein